MICNNCNSNSWKVKHTQDGYNYICSNCGYIGKIQKTRFKLGENPPRRRYNTPQNMHKKTKRLEYELILLNDGIITKEDIPKKYTYLML